MEIKEMIAQIEQWAKDRNLIEGSTPQKQMLKLMEEFGELCGGIAKNNLNTIKDSIGDCFVVMVILSNQIKFIEAVKPNFKILENLKKETKGSVSDDRDVNALILDCVNNIGHMAIPIKRNWMVNINHFEVVNLILVFIAATFDLSFIDCVQHAYNQIKDRKGKMIDGVFVKEEDLTK